MYNTRKLQYVLHKLTNKLAVLGYINNCYFGSISLLSSRLNSTSYTNHSAIAHLGSIRNYNNNNTIMSNANDQMQDNNIQETSNSNEENKMDSAMDCTIANEKDNKTAYVSDPCLYIIGDSYIWKPSGAFQRELLNKHGINCMNVKKESGKGNSLLFFASESDKELAKNQLINLKDSNGKTMFRVAEGRLSEGHKKRQAEKLANQANNNNNNNDNNKRQKSDVKESEPKTIEQIVTPLAHLPYSEQLVQKSKFCSGVLKKVLRSVKNDFPGIVYRYYTNYMICPLEPIVPSPITSGYRNKCEFSVGYNSANQISVGFLAGKYKEGIISVESADNCVHIPDIAKISAKLLQDLANELGNEYKPYDKPTHIGLWRLLTVRNTRSNQLMLTVQLNPTGLSEQQLYELKQKIKSHFVSHMTKSEFISIYKYELKVLQIQCYSGVSNSCPDDCPVELIYGDEGYIYEVLNGLKFRISHHSFFQVNTLGAEQLYNIASKWALEQNDNKDHNTADNNGNNNNTKENTNLLDICCGTGTIGLVMANQFNKIIGLEIVESAINDAIYNAKLNNISNASYICGKAEDTLSKAMKQLNNNENIVGIVDPPRAGLHLDVIRTLRANSKLNTIVYVSCNPSSLANNLYAFLQPETKKYRGAPFHAVKAIPVDMFPHTDHCEMIVLLQRKFDDPVYAASNNNNNNNSFNRTNNNTKNDSGNNDDSNKPTDVNDNDGNNKDSDSESKAKASIKIEV